MSKRPSNIEPILSVVVCTYNRSELLESCLKSLVTQTSERKSIEVIVINNNSNDDTQKVARKFYKKIKNYRIINEKNQGLSHARNRGWKSAKGKFVAFIDDDAKAEQSWCQKIIENFYKHKEIAAVGGQIFPWFESPRPSWLYDDFEVRSWGNEEGYLKLPRAEVGFSGSNMAIKRSILEKYNGFNVKYGMLGGKIRLGEESALFKAIYKQYPYFWYDPDLIVYHWTPNDRMKLSYLLKRKYESGIFLSKVEQKMSAFGYCVSLCEFIVKLIILPFYPFLVKGRYDSNIVFALLDIAKRYGFLSNYPFIKNFSLIS